MQTPLILNQANIAASPTPASKQSNNAPAEAPFNQVLSREMSDRQQANQPAKSSVSEVDKSTPPPKQAQQTGKTEPDTAATEDKAGDTQDAAASDAAAATMASVDMLALVANLSQVSTTPAEVRVAIEGSDKSLPVSLAKQGAATKDSTIAGTDDAQLLQKLQASQADAKEASATPADFAKVIADAKESSATSVAPEVLADASKAGKAKETLPDLTTAGKGKAVASEQPVATKKQEALPDLSVGKAKEAAPDLSNAVKAKEILPGPSGPVTAAVQQATLSLAQTMTAQPVEKLSPPVGTPAWDQALGQKVVWMVAGAQQSATLTLNPPDLGPLQVVLNVNNEHASATFISAQPEVRQALEAAMPKLREMMSDAGIQLGAATVSTGLPNHQQSAPNEQPRQAMSRFDTAGGSVDLAARPMNTTTVTGGGQGMVDTFA